MKLEKNTHFFRMLIGMFGSIINDVMVIRPLDSLQMKSPFTSLGE